MKGWKWLMAAVALVVVLVGVVVNSLSGEGISDCQSCYYCSLANTAVPGLGDTCADVCEKCP